MKKIILLIAVGIISFSLTSYAGASRRDIKKDVKVVLNPSKISLAEKNGMVDVKFQINVPKDFVCKKHQYIFTPVLTDYNNIMPLTSVVIDGKSYAKMAAKQGHSKRMKEKLKSAPDMSNAMTLMASKNPRMINYEVIVPYQPWMQNADLVTVQRFNSKKSTVLVAEDIYGKGVMVTPPPVKPVVNSKSTEKVITKMEGKVNINFLINSSAIDMNLDSNIRELYNLKKIITNAMDNKNNVIDSIVIIASSSPDGSYEFNKKLAAARAQSVKQYLVKEIGMKEKTVDMIKTHYIAENWDGMAKLVEASNVQNKPEILKVIEIPDLAKRERAMMALPQYGYIKKNILPQLRYVKYQIFYHETSIKTIVVATPAPQPAVQQPAPQQQQTMQTMPVPQRVVVKDKHHRRRNVEEVKDNVSPHYVRYHR